jgi:hypothetical protein
LRERAPLPDIQCSGKIDWLSSLVSFLASTTESLPLNSVFFKSQKKNGEQSVPFSFAPFLHALLGSYRVRPHTLFSGYFCEGFSLSGFCDSTESECSLLAMIKLKSMKWYISGNYAKIIK